jgi:hypothetical protein
MDHTFDHVDLFLECKKSWGRSDEEKWKMAACDCSKIAEKGREVCPAVMKHCGKHGWGSFLFSRRRDGTKAWGSERLVISEANLILLSATYRATLASRSISTRTPFGCGFITSLPSLQQNASVLERMIVSFMVFME